MVPVNPNLYKASISPSSVPEYPTLLKGRKTLPSIAPCTLGLAHCAARCWPQGWQLLPRALKPGGCVSPGQAALHQGVTRLSPAFPGHGKQPAPCSPRNLKKSSSRKFCSKMTVVTLVIKTRSKSSLNIPH